MKEDWLSKAGHKTRWLIQPLLWLSFAVYLLLVAYIVFAARRRQLHTPEEFRTFANFIPLNNLLPLKHIMSFSRQSIYDTAENIFGNIALFMPLPFFLRHLLDIKGDRLIIIIALLTSTTIEAMQFIVGVGIADVDDILLNTFGALMGVVAVNKLPKIV